MYKVVTAYLTEEHTDHPIFIDDEVRYTKLIVLKADDECFIKINDTDRDLIRCYQNLKIENIPIKKILLTNKASSVADAKLEILLLEG